MRQHGESFIHESSNVQSVDLARGGGGGGGGGGVLWANPLKKENLTKMFFQVLLNEVLKICEI